jgi:hypothetical protein
VVSDGMYSLDGVNWISSNNIITARGLIYNPDNKLYVAMQNGGTDIYTSIDGNNWLTYSNGYGVNTNIMMYSTKFKQYYTPSTDTAGKWSISATSDPVLYPFRNRLIPTASIQGGGRYSILYLEPYDRFVMMSNQSGLLNYSINNKNLTTYNGISTSNIYANAITGVALTIEGGSIPLLLKNNSTVITLNKNTKINGVLSGDTLCTWVAQANASNNLASSVGEIAFKATENHTITNKGSQFNILTILDGTTVPIERLLIDSDNTTYITGNLNCSEKFNNLTPIGGVYMTTSAANVITATNLEISMLLGASSEGSLVIPANAFRISSYHFNVAGNISTANGNTLTLRLNNSGALAEFAIDLTSSTNEYFELEGDFSIQALGIATLAKIVTNFDFTYSDNATSLRGKRICITNNTTFDTTITNTLSFTVQFSTTSTNNSIQCLQAILTKIY